MALTITGPGGYYHYNSQPMTEAGPNQQTSAARTVKFDANASTDNVGVASYEWEFGDGAKGTGKTVSHTYASGGTYTVTLTVEDQAGNLASDTIILDVPGTTGGFPLDALGIVIAVVSIIAIIAAGISILFWRRRKQAHR